MLNKGFNASTGLLRSNKVDFLVVGAHALGRHGRSRYTGDREIWVRPKPANVSGRTGASPSYGLREALEDPLN